jgi:hypothetical protein
MSAGPLGKSSRYAVTPRVGAGPSSSMATATNRDSKPEPAGGQREEWTILLTGRLPNRHAGHSVSKIYSPQVFDALGESLRAIYWFVDDLKSFLIRCGIPSKDVARLNWKYKRTAIRDLLNEVAAQGPSGTPAVSALIGGVVEQDEKFAHLARLDDGKIKVLEARTAVRALKDLLGHQTVVTRAEAARTEKRTEAERLRTERLERVEALARLRERFMKLAGSGEPQRRGLDFQPWLRDLFALHDLEPRGSFASIGEQIDGSIRLDGQTLLVEARWTKELVAPDGVRDFVGKFEHKLDNTLGLMISVDGFTDAASTKATSGGRLLAIFMDGRDIFPILDGLADLRELLVRKLRHAAEHGEPMYRMGS